MPGEGGGLEESQEECSRRGFGGEKLGVQEEEEGSKKRWRLCIGWGVVEGEQEWGGGGNIHTVNSYRISKIPFLIHITRGLSRSFFKHLQSIFYNVIFYVGGDYIIVR